MQAIPDELQQDGDDALKLVCVEQHEAEPIEVALLGI